MLIRPDQMRTLEAARGASFAEECYEHLCRYAPVLAEASGEPAFRAAVQSGLDNVRQYDLYQRAPARLYLELTITLGGRFDTDPQYGWLCPFLAPTPELAPLTRADLLYWHVNRFLDQACGSGGELGAAALGRCAELDRRRLHLIGQNYSAHAARLLGWLHPEKVDFIGASALEPLVSAAPAAAQAHGLAAPEGPVLALALAFTFGHAVLEDPIHAWTAQALTEAGADPTARLERLLARTSDLLRRLGAA